jgi:hypothetical protein
MTKWNCHGLTGFLVHLHLDQICINLHISTQLHYRTNTCLIVAGEEVGHCGIIHEGILKDGALSL